MNLLEQLLQNNDILHDDILYQQLLGQIEVIFVDLVIGLQENDNGKIDVATAYLGRVLEKHLTFNRQLH